MKLIKTISRAGWSHNAPGGTAIDRTDIECPYFPGQPVYESTSNDGQRASWDPPENRRNDIQANATGPQFGYGVFCVDYAFRMTAVPTFRSGEWGWNMIGFEVHDNGLPQATIQPNVLPCTVSGAQGTSNPRRDPAMADGTLRYFLDANAGLAAHRYFDLGPAPVGTDDAAWDRGIVRMVFRYTDATNGYIKVFREGVLVRTVLGVTVAKSPDGYGKVCNYSREAYVDGVQQYQIAGRIYQCDSDTDLPPMPTRVQPDPPPVPDPTPTPVETLAEVQAQRDALALQVYALTGELATRVLQVGTLTTERDAARASADDLAAQVLTLEAEVDLSHGERDALQVKVIAARAALA